MWFLGIEISYDSRGRFVFMKYLLDGRKSFMYWQQNSSWKKTFDPLFKKKILGYLISSKSLSYLQSILITHVNVHTVGM